MKLLVPSIGSSTQVNSPLPSAANSSPRIACPGKAARIMRRISISMPRSASVTGLPSPLRSMASGVRKCFMAMTRATSASCAARVSAAARSGCSVKLIASSGQSVAALRVRPHLQLEPVAELGEPHGLLLQCRAEPVLPGQTAIMRIVHERAQLGDEALELRLGGKQLLGEQRGAVAQRRRRNLREGVFRVVLHAPAGAAGVPELERL